MIKHMTRINELTTPHKIKCFDVNMNYPKLHDEEIYKENLHVHWKNIVRRAEQPVIFSVRHQRQLLIRQR